MARLLIDTDVLIDVTRNDETAKVRLKEESLNATLCVSDITVMELVIGCRNNTEQQALQKFLAQFEVEPLTETISMQAVSLVKTYALSHGLRIPDALIAATAIANNIGLLSKNQRDYRFISTLDLLPYP